ncbi:MAG TPA: DUF72 domain-containing protein [Rectinemataceae bacterium]|nr:DUF72 domain-containing protein [Rectinemataceae bacterium]
MLGNRFYIGTCGYSYADWREVFYPKDLRQTEFLRFYSLVFPFVELDFSWYTMPRPENLVAMAKQTNPEFLFSLKAHKSLTHEIGEEWRKDAEKFASAAQALYAQGRLASILIQLPYRFSYTADNRKYLGELCSVLSAFPLAVEFRNDVWYQQRVFDELAKRNISLVMIDRPDLPGLPPESRLLTTRTAYYRLHGRNAERWWDGDATSRYDYDYSAQELEERARSLIAISRKTEQVFVAFNNHARGNAVKNARAIIALIKELFIQA